MEAVVVAAESGEDLLEVIAKTLAVEKITDGAVVSGTGTVGELAWKDGAGSEHRVLTADDFPADIACVQGIIANGQPRLQVTAFVEGVAMGGLLLPGTIVDSWAEVVILKLDQAMERRRDRDGSEQLQPRPVKP